MDLSKRTKAFLFNFIFLAGLGLPILAFCGRWHWLLELTSHFRPQYTALLAITTLILLLGKQYTKALLSGIILCGLYATLHSYLWVKAPLETTAPKTLKIFTVNVYTPNREHEKVISLIQQKNPDLIAVIEVNPRWVEALTRALPDYPYRKMVPREDNFGIALFSKIPATITEEYLADLSIPALKGVFEFQGTQMSLWAVHTPPPKNAEYSIWRNAQLKDLRQRILFENLPTLIAGDLNTSPWSSEFFQFTHEGILQDSRLGFGLHLTWPTLVSGWMRIAIDHVLHSPEFKVLRWETLSRVGSDHLPIYVELELKPKEEETLLQKKDLASAGK